MKRTSLIHFLIMIAGYCLATPNTTTSSTLPTKILSITQELYPLDYYEDQINLWHNEISEDDSNANAWMNYYLASRIVNMLTTNHNPHNLADIHKQITTKINGSYEYHYLSYLHGKGDSTLFHHLETAFYMDPTRTEVLSHLVNYYALNGDYEQMTKYNKLWLESGEISSGILTWNYNAIIALEQDAILLTYGDNDTYPSWMLQQVHNIRPDVKIVNIHLLKKRAYIDRIFRECDIKEYLVRKDKDLVWEYDLLPIVDHMFAHSKRPIYVNVTLPKTIRDNYKDVLYTVGLAFKYSVGPFDNMATLKNNYENKFLTDYLRLGFSYDKSVTVLNSMNVNYLPAFISLYKHYLKSENTHRADNIREVIQNIGEASGRMEELARILVKPRSLNRRIESHFDIKQIDKKMKMIKPGLWAATTETTNASYEQFMMDLLKEKEFELLETCKSSKVNWQSLMPEKFKNLDTQIIFKEGHPDDPQVPVVNISYTAAKTYCEWLTMVYNGYEKKKKHRKVIFRLPTEKEWEHAARGNKLASYPWGGNKYRNDQGCYLSNFYSSDDEPCHDCYSKNPDNDGAFFLVKDEAYFPNGYGLYGMSGNAAEMIEGGQIAKGGSWEDIPTECTIASKKKYNSPSPAIGFRIFMEVIN